MPNDLPYIKNRADRIRDLRIRLIRKLDQLLDTATDPGFTGTIAIEVSAKDGILGDRPWFRVNESGFGRDE